MLSAIFVDDLAEVALLVKQSHADHRHPEVAGGLQLVAGDVAQSARVDRQGLAQHELHAEVGGTGQLRVRMCPLEPRRRLHLPTSRLDHALDVLAERGLGQQLFDPFARDRLQDDPRVVRAFPQFGIKAPPDLIGRVVPRPAHIERQLSQRVEALDLRR